MRCTSREAVSVVVLAFFMVSARGQEPMAYRFKESKSGAKVSFELNSNKIFLPARINGGQQRWFVIDSGCPATALDMGVAKQLKLPVIGERPIAGAGEGRSTVGSTKVESLSLSGLDLFPRNVWALDVNTPVSRYEGRRIDGLLGVDFLERFVVRIDYPNRKIDVIDRLQFQPNGSGVTVPLTKVGGHYTVQGATRPRSNAEKKDIAISLRWVAR